MSLFALIVSFGGGIIGMYMGTFPAFILTGVIATVGAVAAMAGGADMTVGSIASGSYPGPRVAFAGGVTAFAHAGRTKKLGSGIGIPSCLSELADPATLLVGSVFGVIGFSTHYVIGAVLHLNTDLLGFTVTISTVTARLVFGSSGLIGKAVPDETREYFTGGREMLCNMILDLGIGITTGFVCQVLMDDGASVASTGSYPVLCFGIAAIPLIFAQARFTMPAAHHTALISALAVVTAQNPVIGAVFGILTSLFGDFIGKAFNSCCDTYIDPSAFAISMSTFTVNVLFGNGFLSA